MLQLIKESKTPYYVQIYEYYRLEIEQQRMIAGMRLPSVRELAQQAGVSKMTVEKAYYQLASEGYITRRCKARYEVAFVRPQQENGADGRSSSFHVALRQSWLYDFGSGDMDMERFPLDIWRKHMNKVLSEPAYLTACNDEQGVPDLRSALSQYAYEVRGVHARPEHIIIGAGTASLLGMLTTLLRSSRLCIAVENPGFRLGRELFRNIGYDIVPISIHKGMLDMDALTASDARLIYVSPSHQFPTGTVMPIGMRQRLLQWAEERDGMIIEDDYDSELRYYGKPVPALQGLDTSGRVIYMGALSKVLPFFVRISYMVLPPRLMMAYHRQRGLFRQGASVPEQCVLAAYIQSGELSRQIRRLRKDYQEKGALMEQFLTEAFGQQMEVSRIESGVYCHVSLRSSYGEAELLRRAEAQGCRVLAVQPFYEVPAQEERKEFLLSFSKIPSQKLKQAVMALRLAWREEER
ncbi:PLP-dependent aminotransferase family protein [uncultured Megasphaera sp.]|uniref:MocR-like pyridoxine biosynthesis transcription factor PdxR n=1 Tax=uncultured Megasphaera sp. TaxID=165188 RepID=UPI00265A7235|nr:PLP-dependent aminotransferase family protein [uncultured Megasphaera sp.]